VVVVVVVVGMVTGNEVCKPQITFGVVVTPPLSTAGITNR